MIDVILVLLAVAAIAGAFWFLTTLPPASILRLARWGLGALVVAVLIFLLATGRGALDIPLAVLLFYLRSGGSVPGMALFKRLRGFLLGQPAPAPASSAIETPWLRMALDRESGALDGEVLAGQFAGAPLARLGLDQLRALLAECGGADPQSARLVEAYLDRTHPGWRDQKQAPPTSGPMSRDEALQVLGLAGDAGEEQIRDAHRRLMLKLHPDLGGSDYLAGKINLARDVLLQG
jgi:hypothetical protein